MISRGVERAKGLIGYNYGRETSETTITERPIPSEGRDIDALRTACRFTLSADVILAPRDNSSDLYWNS